MATKTAERDWLFLVCPRTEPMCSSWRAENAALRASCRSSRPRTRACGHRPRSRSTWPPRVSARPRKALAELGKRQTRELRRDAAAAQLELAALLARWEAGDASDVPRLPDLLDQVSRFGAAGLRPLKKSALGRITTYFHELALYHAEQKRRK